MPKKRKRARDTREKGDATAARKPPPRVGTELGAVLKQAGLARVVAATAPAARGVASSAARAPATLASSGPARAPGAGPARAPGAGPRTVGVAPPKAAEGVSQPKAAGGVTSPKAGSEPARPLSAAELRMLNDAYQGARPLSNKKSERVRVAGPVGPRVDPRETERAAQRAEELAARTRLAELVTGGVRFKLRQDDDYVEGLRADTSPKLLARLQGAGFSPEATLDLHGLRGVQVGAAVERFVRTCQRRGARHVLLIAGKGLHSEGGVSVLGPAAVEALSQGLAAPWVLAFSTAHTLHGGSGALAVLLRD